MTVALRRSRATSTLAACLFAVCVAALATAGVCATIGGVSFADAVGSFAVTNAAMGMAFGVCGLLLALHRPGNPIGWLFLAAGLAESMSAAAIQLAGLGAADDWPIGALRLLGTMFAYPWAFSIGLFLPLALLLFPDGRPAGPRWRWVLWIAVAEGILFVASSADPQPREIGDRAVTPYLTIPFYADLNWLWTAGSGVGWAAIMAAALASLVVRYRRGDQTQRRQLLWLLLAVLVVLAYAGLAWGVIGGAPILGLLVIPLVPAAITVAILRHQLLDIRLVVSRAFLYGLLTTAAALAYLGIVALLDVLVRSRVSLAGAVVAGVVIAIGFNPARVRLQRFIDRSFYGDRRDPTRTVSLVGTRLAATAATGSAGCSRRCANR
jgi:hypothetical protein